MTDYNTIQTISDRLHTRPTAGENHDMFADELIIKYPYFIPARYIRAAQQHDDHPFSHKMLAGIYPYSGNWLLLCDMLQGITPEKAVTESEETYTAPVFTFEEISTTEDTLSRADEGETTLLLTSSTTLEDEYTFTLSLTDTEDMPVVEDLPQQQSNITESDEISEIKEPVRHTAASDDLIAPLYSEDYFMQQGLKISPELPADIAPLQSTFVAEEDDKAKSLMVMMSFTEWLLHFRNTAEKQQSEQDDKKAIRTMWQKEKLAAAMEEENDEIPENVFEMAVNSITSEDGLASESLAEIYTKQQKYDKAVEMYRKLSLRNPQKSAYFARKIEEVLKEKQL